MTKINKTEEAGAQLERDLQGLIDAYIMTNVQDDELSVTIINNGEGWRIFLGNMRTRMGSGLDRAALMELVYEQYYMDCFENEVI